MKNILPFTMASLWLPNSVDQCFCKSKRRPVTDVIHNDKPICPVQLAREGKSGFLRLKMNQVH